MGIRLEARQMLRELIGPTERLPQQIFSERLNPTIDGTDVLYRDLLLVGLQRRLKGIKMVQGS